ncbi:copper chaperone PCu(A)C [Deinococcus psychrotolerans]|uniref:Copper chaperone PCu(A)C n=1 Tax=Deinococcus psychrotolerans TaxID=2489213 RepID=A0A3G8YEM9_9DEIO|nr:copper chaperone PCu(A)C [Deinococcus psychrotolerans]AZI42607.1 copper chaperone PCu(A)C [Deinococcus psychrotolerans]
MSLQSVFFALILLAVVPAAQAQQHHSMPGMTMPVPAQPATSTAKKLPAAPVKISGAFVQALPPSAADGSVYLSITNTGKAALKLTGGTSNVSKAVTPMQQTKMEGMAGMTGMKDLPTMIIKAGQTLTLSPGGNHLMLYRMKRVPQVGEKVTLTLNFTGYAPLTLKVPVKRL